MIEQIVSKFSDLYPENLLIVLLQIIAPKEQGGRGYKIEIFNPSVDLDGWEVDHNRKIIKLDRKGIFSNYTYDELAENLKFAIETEFLKTRESLLARVGWGTGKLVLGIAETAVGIVGVIVPEPGTTAGGVVMVALGANTVIDGMSQLSGVNQGHGIDLLSAGFGYVGAGIADLADVDREVGRTVGKGVFLISSIAVGSFASIKVIRAPKKALMSFKVGGRPGGLQIGRIDTFYSSERLKDGITILSINNNAGQSILRFVTHNGKIMVNGRIVGVPNGNILRHERDARKILKGILKLMVNGAKY